MFILMGLGNPGPKYEQTRHNIGFTYLNRLAQEIGSANWKEEGKAFTQKIKFGDTPILLAKPQTFMNLSGESAQSLLSFYKIPLQNLIVVVDDIYLNLGQMKVRADGGHGGHNGLRNIIQHLGDKFIRVRIGVGPCPPQEDLANFVLRHYDTNDQKKFETLYPDFKNLITMGLTQGWEKAANRFNRRAQNPL